MELTEHSDVDMARLHHPGLPGDQVGDVAVEEVVVDFLCHYHAQITGDGKQATGLEGDSGIYAHFWVRREIKSMFKKETRKQGEQEKTLKQEEKTWD